MYFLHQIICFFGDEKLYFRSIFKFSCPPKTNIRRKQDYIDIGNG